MVHASAIMKTSATTAALAAIAVGSAAPTTASTDDYLKLRESYPSLSAQQLLAEGARVCSLAKQTVPSPTAVNMVMQDLGVSVDEALSIVSAAILDLDC